MVLLLQSYQHLVKVLPNLVINSIEKRPNTKTNFSHLLNIAVSAMLMVYLSTVALYYGIVLSVKFHPFSNAQ